MKQVFVPAVFAEALQLKRDIEAVADDASAGLKPFEVYRAGMGLLPDSVLFSPEYQKASDAWRAAFSALQNYNASFVKLHKKAYNAYIQNQRMERLNAQEK